jgi:hypothetical protein
MPQKRKGHALVLDEETGEPRILVIDAEDLDDPAWQPEGHVKVEIPDALHKSHRGVEHHKVLVEYATKEAEEKLGKKFKKKDAVIDAVVE